MGPCSGSEKVATGLAPSDDSLIPPGLDVQALGSQRTFSRGSVRKHPWMLAAMSSLWGRWEDLESGRLDSLPSEARGSLRAELCS